MVRRLVQSQGGGSFTMGSDVDVFRALELRAAASHLSPGALRQRRKKAEADAARRELRTMQRVQQRYQRPSMKGTTALPSIAFVWELYRAYHAAAPAVVEPVADAVAQIDRQQNGSGSGKGRASASTLQSRRRRPARRASDALFVELDGDDWWQQPRDSTKPSTSMSADDEAQEARYYYALAHDATALSAAASAPVSPPDAAANHAGGDRASRRLRRTSTSIDKENTSSQQTAVERVRPVVGCDAAWFHTELCPPPQALALVPSHVTAEGHRKSAVRVRIKRTPLDFEWQVRPVLCVHPSPLASTSHQPPLPLARLPATAALLAPSLLRSIQTALWAPDCAKAIGALQKVCSKHSSQLSPCMPMCVFLRRIMRIDDVDAHVLDFAAIQRAFRDATRRLNFGEHTTIVASRSEANGSEHPVVVVASRAPIGLILKVRHCFCPSPTTQPHASRLTPPSSSQPAVKDCGIGAVISSVHPYGQFAGHLAPGDR